jgi:hypothetical protein
MSTSGYVPSLTLLALAGLSACGAQDSQGSASPPLENSLSVRATDLGPLTTNPDILGRDGAYSAQFEGYSVWLYGDTFMANPDASGRTFVSDTWSFTSDLTASDGITGFQERLDAVGSPTMILQETPDEQAFNAAHSGNPCQEQPCGARWALWPSSIVVDPVLNRGLIFYMVVSALPGDFNFQGVGNSVATWQSFADRPQRPVLNPALVADHPDLMFNQNEPDFGAAAFISAGTLYVYGCSVPNNGWDKGCRVAKVNPATVQDRSTWTFYAGGSMWSSSINDAISVFNGNDILSVSWNNYLQRYIAVYSVPFSQNVVIRTSPAPQGPWSAELLAFTAMQPQQGNTYDAHEHSEYDVNGGQTIYVSYSRGLPASFASEVRLVSLQLQTTGPLP